MVTVANFLSYFYWGIKYLLADHFTVRKEICNISSLEKCKNRHLHVEMLPILKIHSLIIIAKIYCIFID